MAETFVIADTHFGHAGVTKFLAPNGVDKLRPWDTIEEMDEALIENWNSAVRPKDKVYHLGDVVINRKALKTLSRLNGDKVLIAGNHDIFRLDEYLQYFRDRRANQVFDGFIMTHIPIHSQSLERWTGNVHGHLHANRVMRERVVEQYKWQEIDPKYLCVSVEQINYTPVSWDEVKKMYEAQQ